MDTNQPSIAPLSGLSCNEPFGSRPEPGASLIAPILELPPGEVPEGRARGCQDTVMRVRCESAFRGPEREPGVTGEAFLLLRPPRDFSPVTKSVPFTT